MKSSTAGSIPGTAAEAFDRRRVAGLSLVSHAEALARTAQAMAARFGKGGRLLAFGLGPSSTDAHHIAVEFVHPVIVGKRSLPAMALCPSISLADPASLFVHPLRTFAQPADIALALSLDGGDESLRRGLQTALDLRLLTVALTGPDSILVADHVLSIPADDPLIVKEVQVTAYHILWELVHLYLA